MVSSKMTTKAKKKPTPDPTHPAPPSPPSVTIGSACRWVITTTVPETLKQWITTTKGA